MPNGPGYHRRQPVLAEKICSLLSSLNPSTYDEIAPKIEYWIEYVITEQFTTTDDLVERVSPVVWSCGPHVSRFLKQFRDAPHRSERARSFVDKLCLHLLRWFAIASTENLGLNGGQAEVSKHGGIGYICAASFVGHLIECGLLGHDLVRQHLVKPLITHHYADGKSACKFVRANAIYQLFIAAGNTLLQGPLEPEDVRVCFETLDTQFYYSIGGLAGFDAARLNVRCESRLDSLHYNLTCAPGTSRDPRHMVATQRGGTEGCRGDRRGGWGHCRVFPRGPRNTRRFRSSRSSYHRD